MRTGSALEQALMFQVHAAGLPAPQREVRFHPPRKWRFDLAWPERLLAVEIEGGTFMRGGGRHSRGVGMRKDCEKYNTALLEGWAVLRVTGDMVKDGSALTVVEQALQ